MKLTKFKPCYIVREVLVNLIKKKKKGKISVKIGFFPLNG